MATSGRIGSFKDRGKCWHVYLRAQHIFWTESRIVQIFIRCTQFLTTVAIMLGNSEALIYFVLLVNFFGLVPLIFLANLEVFVLVGDRMDLTDEDFPHIFRALFEHTAMAVDNGEGDDELHLVIYSLYFWLVYVCAMFYSYHKYNHI